MASNLKLFSPSTYSGGGTFFNDGLYKVEKSLFVKYDYNGSAPGKDGDGLVSLCLTLQPVNKDGDDSGEPVVQYWGVGDEFEITGKGKSIKPTGQYESIWKLCDFAVFVDHLGKAGLDMDELEEGDDISVLAGKVMEFGKVPSPRTQQTKKDDEDSSKKSRGPKQVVVVTDANPTKASGKTKKAAAGAGSKSSGGGDNELQETLTNYLTEKVLVSKNEGGIDLLQARMGLKKYVESKGGDNDKVKAISTLYNNAKVLGAILKDNGWKVDDDDNIVKG